MCCVTGALDVTQKSRPQIKASVVSLGPSVPSVAVTGREVCVSVFICRCICLSVCFPLCPSHPPSLSPLRQGFSSFARLHTPAAAWQPASEPNPSWREWCSVALALRGDGCVALLDYLRSQDAKPLGASSCVRSAREIRIELSRKMILCCCC